MPFQIDGRHGCGGIKELEYDANGPEFMKRVLVENPNSLFRNAGLFVLFTNSLVLH